MVNLQPLWHLLSIPGLRGKKRIALGLLAPVFFVLPIYYDTAYVRLALGYALAPLGIFKLPFSLRFTIALIVISVLPCVALYISAVCFLDNGGPVPSSLN